MEHHKALVVDDDEVIRKMLTRYLSHLGYEVDSAASTNEAIDRIMHAHFDVVLTDVRMPGPDGMELLAWITGHRPETGVIILSGCDDVKLAVRAMKSGALDYIVKPFVLEDVGETLSKCIVRHRTALERSRYLASLETTLQERSKELRTTLDQLEGASQETLEALAAALDARERETQAHSKRVSEYSVHLARELGVGESDVEVIRQGSILHDIGKIGVPDSILLKPGELTDEEWKEMRKHPEIGSWIVTSVEAFKPASGIVIAHHERFDGSGYPYGLKGPEIPLGARIFAVADTLDAMLSDRPYRCGQSYEQARDEIARNAGIQFDPQVTECFLSTPPAVWEQIRERTGARQPSPLVLA